MIDTNEMKQLQECIPVECVPSTAVAFSCNACPQPCMPPVTHAPLPCMPPPPCICPHWHACPLPCMPPLPSMPPPDMHAPCHACPLPCNAPHHACPPCHTCPLPHTPPATHALPCHAHAPCMQNDRCLWKHYLPQLLLRTVKMKFLTPVVQKL